MKKIFLLFFFAFAQQVHSQNYLPLPDSNAVWIVDAYRGGPLPDSLGKLLVSPNLHDTVINSQSYNNLYKDTVSYATYFGAYRSDTTGKTYFVQPDSVQEHLLMDLSANAGDTIFNVLYYGAQYLKNAVVDSVNFIVAGPYILKRVYIHFPPISVENVWIEKVGSTGGFFNEADFFPYLFLQCMSFNDTTYYLNNTGFPYVYQSPGYTQGTCNLPSGIDNILSSDEIIIGPNPASQSITVSSRSNSLIDEIKIYDSTSRLTLHKKNLREEKSITIDLEKLTKGIYCLVLYQRGENIQTKKIIKM